MNNSKLSTYNIILADSYAIIRQGVKKIIQTLTNVDVIGETDDGVELLELIKKNKPNLVILDINLSGYSGLEATRQIKNIYPEVKVLILTMNNSNYSILQAFSAAADGYLLKEDKESDLIKAIETLRAGRSYLSPLIFPGLIDAFSKKKEEKAPEEGLSKLSGREQEILRFIAYGNSSKEIGDMLFISSSTVKKHRANIMKKLNLHKNVDLVKFSIQHGFSELPPDMIDFNRFILRSIEFSPAHHEAGMTILSYFGKIVRQKYPGIKVRIKIEQEGLTVRMIIQTDDGNIEKIEKTLEEYGLVIKGEMPINEFISDPYQVAELKHQLRIAHVQLESQKDLLALTKNMHEQRFFNLEEEVNHLRSCIAKGLKLLDNRDNILESSLKLIEIKLVKDIDQQDFLELKEALQKIQQINQPLFARIIDKINLLFIQGSISGVAGNALYDLIKTLSKAM